MQEDGAYSYGQYGSLQEEQVSQTVPRAELTALERCLDHLQHIAWVGETTIYSDASIVVDGIHKGWQHCSASELSEYWRRIFTKIFNIAAGGGQVTVLKIKGHITEEEVRAGTWSLL